jgi:hypothetical protein
MSLPATVGSVTLASREAAIGSLQRLLGDRLSTAAPITALARIAKVFTLLSWI